MIWLEKNSLTTQEMVKEMVSYIENNIFCDEDEYDAKDFLASMFMPKGATANDAYTVWEALKKHVYDEKRMFCLSIVEQYMLAAIIKYYWDDIFGDVDHWLLDSFSLDSISGVADFAGIVMETEEVENYLLQK